MRVHKVPAINKGDGPRNLNYKNVAPAAYLQFEMHYSAIYLIPIAALTQSNKKN